MEGVGPSSSQSHTPWRAIEVQQVSFSQPWEIPEAAIVAVLAPCPLLDAFFRMKVVLGYLIGLVCKRGSRLGGLHTGNS